MEWKYGPGKGPVSLPTDHPSSKTIDAYAQLLDDDSLSFANFDRDFGTVLWRRLDDEVAAGRLPAAEVELLRRDHDGAYSIPLARRYLDAGNATAVTAWMRDKASFWSYDWVDRSVRGARGSGTLRLFETLHAHGGATEGADLAADHLWHRLVGARFHQGLRQELRTWYQRGDREQRRAKVLDHRARFGNPHHIEVVFDWLDHIAAKLRPFIEAGSAEAVDRLARVEGEVARSRAKFAEELV